MTTTTKLAALLAAGALLLGACSDGDGDEASDDGNDEDTTETTEASSSDSTGEGPSINPDAPEADSQFCQDAAELMTTSAADAEALDFADSLEPPDEIADEWRSMLDTTRAVNEADASGDPEAGQKAMEAYQAVQADITKVLEYLQGQCGIDAGV